MLETGPISVHVKRKKRIGFNQCFDQKINLAPLWPFSSIPGSWRAGAAA